jgi:hypothetical protein
MKFSVFIAFFLVFTACSEKASESYPEPDNLLEKEEMVEILTELTFLESAYQVKYIQVSRYSSLIDQQADSLFRALGTDKKSFEESIEYYTRHQEDLVEIYQQVKSNFEKRIAELPPVTDEQGVVSETSRIMTEEDMGRLNSAN